MEKRKKEKNKLIESIRSFTSDEASFRYYSLLSNTTRKFGWIWLVDIFKILKSCFWGETLTVKTKHDDYSLRLFVCFSWLDVLSIWSAISIVHAWFASWIHPFAFVVDSQESIRMCVNGGRALNYKITTTNEFEIQILAQSCGNKWMKKKKEKIWIEWSARDRKCVRTKNFNASGES